MPDIDVDGLRRFLSEAIEDAITRWAAGEAPQKSPANELSEVKDTKPTNKRVVRTKASGDKVYLLDEAQKTRQWVAKPEVLEGLGFTMEDVVEINDAEAFKYSMGPALYQ